MLSHLQSAGAEPLHLRAGLAGGVALLTALLAGPALIALLKRGRIGDTGAKGDSEALDRLHGTKRHTPTLGGLLIVGGAALGLVAAGPGASFEVLVLLGCTLSLATLGLVDDLLKLRTGGKGVRPRLKLVAQALVGVAVGVALYAERGGLDLEVARASVRAEASAEAGVPAEPLPAPLRADAVAVPFAPRSSVPLGLAYVLFAALVVVATTNAFNFTDGLDGLAGGTGALALGTFAALAWLAAAPGSVSGRIGAAGAADACVFAAALGGGLVGFLWHNVHPARIFMGDTGSLAVGGALAALALTLRHELLLPIAGGVFVLEGLSVLVQVVVFKLTGRRVLRIAPIHHHFQFGGLRETEITLRLWIVGAALAVLALIAALGGGA